MIHGSGWDPDDEGRIERAAHRAVQRRHRSLWARLKRAGVYVCVYIAAGAFVSLDPPRWFHPPVCDTEKSATTAAVPAAVKVAKDQGRLLRRLAGKPPTPEATDRFARHAADVVVVTTLAFLASARDEQEPAKVTAYNTAHARRVAAQDAAWKAGCTPPCPPNQPGQIGPGTMTVAATGAGPEATARAAAAAAGFTGRHLEEAMAVARLETGGTFKATAANPRSSARGVWQIMLSAHQDDPDIRRWADPFASARMAFRISAGGTNWGPWTTWPAAQRSLGAAPAAAAQPVASGSCTVAPAPQTSTYKTGAGVAWGGYANGRIPASAMAHPRSAPTAWFRPDAAAAYDRLSAAYAARFGHPLRATDSYRSYAAQVSVRERKPGLAAQPGTSNHGWGLAADVVVGGYGSTDYVWLRANAPRFGWDNPTWARPGGSKAEPWHWEFNPAGVAA